MTNKRKNFSLFEVLVLISIIQIASFEPDQLHFRGGGCSPFENFTPNSTYQSNLHSLLSSLNTESSQFKFSNNSVGTLDNRVNGLYNCRPDLSLETCQACVKAATQVFFDKCAIKKEAIMWYEECTLRYSNRTIFSIEEIEPSIWTSSIFNVSQAEVFSSLLNRTMEGLIARASLPSNTLHFATSEDDFTLFEGLYGLALCTPDITSVQCEVCLRAALEIFPQCCGDLVQFVMVFLPSCQLRYDTAPFIFNSAAPPSLAPGPSPLGLA